MEQRQKIKIKGKIIGSILGGFLSGSFFGIVLGGIFGHFLFDLNDNIFEDSFETIGEYEPFENTTILHGIINLALNIVHFKNSHQLPRLDYVKEYLIEQFQFDINDINLIDSIARQLTKKEIEPFEMEKCTKIINLYTSADERKKILELFFLLASYEGSMLLIQEQYIQKIARDIKIDDVVYLNIRKKYYDELTAEFEILGLSPGSTVEEIKNAYDLLMTELHPDKQDKTFDKKKFQKVVHAYKKIKRVKNIV